MRLFPLSSIKEYLIPSLTVQNDSYTITNSFSAGINPFTGMNLQNITVTASDTSYITGVTIENSNSTTLSDGTLQTTGDIIFNVEKNPFTGKTISANIIVTGTRTDGKGKISSIISLTWDKTATYANITGVDQPINIPYNGSLQVFIQSNTNWALSLTSSSNFSFENNDKSKTGGGNSSFYIYNTGGSNTSTNRDTLTVNYNNGNGGMNTNTYDVKIRNT